MGISHIDQVVVEGAGSAQVAAERGTTQTARRSAVRLGVSAGPSCNGATTMASFVLSTITFSSACSRWGTANLSSVC
jgi:hypothetical protein